MFAIMFARTTSGHGRSNGGRLLRVETDFCTHHKNQDAGRRKYFLGAASVMCRPVICQVSSAGKHFLQLKTFVWNTRLIWILSLPFAG